MSTPARNMADSTARVAGIEFHRPRPYRGPSPYRIGMSGECEIQSSTQCELTSSPRTTPVRTSRRITAYATPTSTDQPIAATIPCEYGMYSRTSGDAAVAPGWICARSIPHRLKIGHRMSSTCGAASKTGSAARGATRLAANPNAKWPMNICRSYQAPPAVTLLIDSGQIHVDAGAQRGERRLAGARDGRNEPTLARRPALARFARGLAGEGPSRHAVVRDGHEVASRLRQIFSKILHQILEFGI